MPRSIATSSSAPPTNFSARTWEFSSASASTSQRLRPYKVRPLTDAIPNRWEWGTLNHECIAGITACVDYIADLGRHATTPSKLATRRAAIVAAFEAIHRHEHALMNRLIAGLSQIPQLKIYGITDPSCFAWRCPTLAVRVINQTADQTPLALATKLGDRGFFTWDGNYYALNLTERLDVEKSGGFLRIGLVHYNTVEEVDRLLAALREICGSKSTPEVKAGKAAFTGAKSARTELIGRLSTRADVVPGWHGSANLRAAKPITSPMQRRCLRPALGGIVPTGCAHRLRRCTTEAPECGSAAAVRSPP